MEMSLVELLSGILKEKKNDSSPENENSEKFTHPHVIKPV